MANEYLDKEGLKRLVSLLKDEMKKVSVGVSEERVQELIDAKFGNIEAVLDNIIALQNTLIGGNV